MYPLVNVYKKRWNITIFDGSMNYLYGHGFKFADCKGLPGRVDHFIMLYSSIIPLSMGFPLQTIHSWDNPHQINIHI